MLTIPACSCSCTYSSNLVIYIHTYIYYFDNIYIYKLRLFTIYIYYYTYPQYPQISTSTSERQTVCRAKRLHVSPIVVIDGFHLALVEFLKGHPAIAVAVHLLSPFNPPEMAHFMGKKWGKYRIYIYMDI